ncbi:neuropeptide Y receptor type 1 [Ictalurus punctatus]|uniref:Neuropeptide Y receptor type 1 n=1 Tax=Ictalurus punctatus TaxID=7998 RepID=A0A2D0QHZ9_ICTPU|nr:neuropeptide Y receptor type 1 [Ictalurus punctatus]
MPDTYLLPPAPPLAILNCSSPNCTLANFSAFHGDECHADQPLFVTLAVAYIAVALLGVTGNLALIVLIWSQRELSNATSVLIANLSASDLLMAVISLPFTFVYTFMDHWIFGSAMCKINSLVQCTSVSVSIFSLVLIAVERHQLIVRPRGWRPSAFHACLGVGLSWALALLTAMPFLLFSITTDAPLQQLPAIMREHYQGKVVCMEQWPSRQFRLAYTTTMLLLQYVAPLTFIFICYLKIYVRLRQRKSVMERMRENKYRSHETKRINVMLFSIVVAFAICWLPLNVFNAVVDWNHEATMNCTHNPLFLLCHLTAMCSICINPIFYGFLNRNFQRDLHSFRLCKRLSTREEEYDTVAMSTIHSDLSKASLKLSSTDI